ncbi:hypothetical protein ACSLFT_34710 (plasmid) [Streptomyces sp. G6]|uniref:hypothetical protein n=1 Tax=Streptomyces sp. G6 TaxID=1178736 RepID=UPI003ED8947D
MASKKMEGDEAQRRRAAHEAHRSGASPSEQGRTTGASKQRTHLPHRDSISHEERLKSVHRGKQGGEPRKAARSRDSVVASRSPSSAGRNGEPYTEAHEQVFEALSQVEQEHEGEAVHLDEVARSAGLSTDETSGLLHDLVTVHGLATELSGSDTPDMGPRFEIKRRL